MALAGEPISLLPAASALTDADLLVVVQGAAPAVTKKSTVGAMRTAIAGLSLISADTALVSGSAYGVLTGTAVVTGTLPAAAPGLRVVVFDADNNAATNHATIVPVGGDVIRYYGLSGTSFVLNVNSSQVEFIGETGAWRVIAA